MVDIYKTDNKVLSKLDNIEDGCWINMVNPTSSELSLVSGYFDIDADDLATALDEEESSRISLEDGYTLILVDIPTPEDVRVVKIRRGVNDALDHLGDARRKRALAQLGGDDFKRPLFNVLRLHVSIQNSIPSRAAMPFSNGCRCIFISVM